MKFAIAKMINGKEEYLREHKGDDCFTDDIGEAILSDDRPGHMQIQNGEYWVAVDDSDGLSVMDH